MALDNLNFYHFLQFTVGKPELITIWLFSKQRIHGLTKVSLWFFFLNLRNPTLQTGSTPTGLTLLRSKRYAYLYYILYLFFLTGGKSHLRKTTSKKPLEQSTIQYFEQSKIWKMENEFYEFANKVFQTAKKRALTSKSGLPEATGKQFFYEKIRPKEPS